MDRGEDGVNKVSMHWVIYKQIYYLLFYFELSVVIIFFKKMYNEKNILLKIKA